MALIYFEVISAPKAGLELLTRDQESDALLSEPARRPMALIFKYLTSDHHNKCLQTFLAFPEMERKMKMLISFDGNKTFLLINTVMVNTMCP